MDLDADTALLLIDVQKAFDDPSWGKRNNPEAEQAIARLLARWRTLGSPVLHVRHDSVDAASPLHPTHEGNALKPEAAPKADEPIYRKTVNSAFIGTDLEEDLRSRGITTLVIVGLTTNHCVSTTARMAGNLGFCTFVVSDATAAFERPAIDGVMRDADDVHRAALSDLHGEFATVISSDELLTRSAAS